MYKTGTKDTIAEKSGVFVPANYRLKRPFARHVKELQLFVQGRS
jgi:hypothetical protein